MPHPTSPSNSQSGKNLLLVHPEPEDLASLETTLAPLRHRLFVVKDFAAALRVWDQERIDLVVAGPIALPERQSGLVERLQRESLHLPVVLLLPPTAADCPLAAKFLAGPQVYVAWPDERPSLAGLIQGLLRTHALLYQHATPGATGWVDSLRQAGDAQQRRDIVNALRVADGNLQRAANLLGLSRGGLQHRLRKFEITRANAARP